MLPSTGVDEALALLLQQVRVLDAKPFALEAALGLVLAEGVFALEQHPADDTSAMDGFAVRSEDLIGASGESPVVVRLKEDIAAGIPPAEVVGSGEVSRISTGGLVPEGADAVVMREYVEASESEARFTTPIERKANIRFAGEHIQVGEELLSEGALLGSAEIGMAAYLGREELLCRPRPRVAVLATGSELVGANTKLARGQIRDSNGISLSSALREMGCEVTLQKRVPDSQAALDEALEEAFQQSDLVVTSGGISAGWHDLVRDRIERRGGEFHFHKLRMRPGKPLAFGKCDDTLFFCLPGNPVSSMVTFEVFAKPALRKMAGKAAMEDGLQARLEERIVKKAGFTIFFRGVATRTNGAFSVRLTGPQGSHMLRSLVEANVLIRADEKASVLEAGSTVTIIPIKG